MEPLNALLQGHGTSAAMKRSKKKKKPIAEYKWNEDQQLAFKKIKELLTQPPVLAYAEYSLPFILHTDSSGSGLGAVLYQKQGTERIIAYASQGLRPSERNYPAHKLEFHSLKWVVTDKCHDYLYGSTFHVTADNNPLTYVLTKAKLDATSHRWVAVLTGYNFTISYEQGH